MARDPLTGERIIWTGRPEVLETPPFMKIVALVFFVIAFVATLFAVVVRAALGGSPAALLALGAWTATWGLVALQGMKLWLAQVRYIVTERHVIIQRGVFRRSIERRAVSFARVFWSPRFPDVGDVELVRAVQTGPLRRRLTLRLYGVRRPNRVWAIIRGAESLAPVGSSHLPLPQRLDVDERVVWAARPHPRLKSYVPSSPRELGHMALALMVFATAALLMVRAAPNTSGLVGSGMAAGSAAFIALVAAEVLTALLLVGLAFYYAYVGVVRAARLVRDTRYMITNKHVLISRGREELHLERSKIVDVIDTRAGDGVHDVFLVLDGPRARSLATSGAFGEMERGTSLRPVFLAVNDAESVSRILRSRPSRPDPELPRAA